MKYIGYIILLLLVIAGVSFAVLNSAPVDVNYYFATKHMPLSLLLVITFAVGVVLAFFVMFFRLMRYSFEIRRLRKQIKQLEKAQG